MNLKQPIASLNKNELKMEGLRAPRQKHAAKKRGHKSASKSKKPAKKAKKAKAKKSAIYKMILA